MSVAQWEQAFPDERACCAYLVHNRWNNGVACPRCGSENVRASGKEFQWYCHSCAQHRYRFSATSGTMFENRKVSLRIWLRVIHSLLTSEKKINEIEICRSLGTLSYKTVRRMCREIRVEFLDPEFRRLIGVDSAAKAIPLRKRDHVLVSLRNSSPEEAPAD